MAYEIISQNNTVTTLADELGHVIRVPSRAILASDTTFTVTEVNNNTATLEDSNGKVYRDIPCMAVLYGGSGGSGDTHNKGYYATQAALEEAYPTASAGDYAIVGSTDTVWLWDTDTSAWVDSDQKGQVTSVNGQTGVVVLSIPDAVQYSAMPTAGADNLGDIVQFTGTTDANYTNGYFYKCVSDGQEPATYSWTQTNVQPAPSGLPDQTGQSGKFLTTDGTDASWSDKPLVNTATGIDSVGIRVTSPGTYNHITAINGITDGANAIAIGYVPSAYSSARAQSNSVAIGSTTLSSYSVAVGVSSSVATSSKGGIAIGYQASAKAAGSIQINSAGNNATYQTNSDANTFKVANANGNFEIMSADGTVPTARLTKVNTTATLAVADWSSNTQTVTVSGVKADSVVFVSPDPASASDYASAGILCTSQSADSLTFTATTTPSVAIVVNIICL